ncbi:Voltage-dependent L-type calcium channel subunit alpha-1S [Dirofilaria immitis]
MAIIILFNTARLAQLRLSQEIEHCVTFHQNIVIVNKFSRVNNMLSSWVRLATKRTDVRPFHKRIFTSNVLDKMYSLTVITLIGGALCMTSVAIVNAIMYYKVVKPVREADRERLEKDLIEADEAELSSIDGFQLYLKCEVFFFSKCFRVLFKIKFTFMGVNYYTVFRKKQMQQQLEDFENWLKQMDELSAQAVQSQTEARKKSNFQSETK